MSINKGMMSSNTDQWATPQMFFDEVNAEFQFDVDVCADHNNAKCDLYFTKEMDGLKQNWGGHVCWMNPPYGREIGKWVKKAAESGTVVVALLPAVKETVVRVRPMLTGLAKVMDDPLGLDTGKRTKMTAKRRTK